MSYFRCGDPLDDFDRLDREQAEHEKKYPVCCHCGKPITDNKMFVIDDNFYHVDCAEDEFMKWTEDYMEED
jgi:RNA polymerase-binding transcription factor DksA